MSDLSKAPARVDPFRALQFRGPPRRDTRGEAIGSARWSRPMQRRRKRSWWPVRFAPIAALHFLEQGADEDGAPPILTAARGRTMRAVRAGAFSISNFFGRQD